MRDCIGFVDAQCALVVALRLVKLVLFETKVAEVHHRRKTTLVGSQSRVKIAFGSGLIAETQAADTAFGERRGGIVVGGDGGRELIERRREVATLEGAQRLREMAHRRMPTKRRLPRRAVRKPVNPMHVDIVTLFPQFFEPIIGGSIIGRARSKGLVTISLRDLWSFVPAGERADDAPYGGGPGMILRLGPLISCMEALIGPDLAVPDSCLIVVPSPAGQHFDHAAAKALAGFSRLILVCGHYEGIDERFFDLVKATELSVGDFILTGGEIPALAFVDAAIRLLPGAIAAESSQAESFSAGDLDWPHYTRPALFRGLAVPEVLLSGDHARVAGWRAETARKRTATRRPDLGRR